MEKNIFAYTAAAQAYPAYVSINRTETGDVRITVRGSPDTVPTADQSSLHTARGLSASITIPAAAWPDNGSLPMEDHND